MGYPGVIDAKLLRQAYCDVTPPVLAPDKEEYMEIFKIGNLSVSPSRLVACNSSAVACEVATTPGFSGSPVCLPANPMNVH